MNYRKTTNLGSRTISFFLAFLLLFSLIAPIMNTSYAGESAVIKPLIDSMNGGYVVSVELEDGKHEEAKTINLSSFVGKTGSEMVLAGSGWSAMANRYDNGIPADKTFTDTTGLSHPLLGWPANNENAKTVDSRRASEVATKLARTLNTLISYVTTPSKGKSVEGQEKNIKATIDASYALDPSIAGTSTVTITKDGKTLATIYYATDYTNKNLTINSKSVPAYNDEYELLCYVVQNTSDTEKDSFASSGMPWAIPKGYNGITVGSTDVPAAIANSENPQDITMVTCFMIAQYGNQLYREEGAHTQANTSNEDVNFLLKMIYGIFDGLLSGLESLLGLYNMDELIFNEGTRGGIGFEDGLMHSTWWSIVLKYFTIFQVIAWMAIAIAIVKSLVQVNLGTISSNSTQRAQLMDTLVKLVTVGLLLTLCIPIIRLFVQVNNAVVDIFASSYSGDMAKMPYSPNILVGLVMMFFSFMMSFYTNFIYIMRSITLAILIAMGPFFIVTMAFSKKNLFESWLKEVVANIFLQSFHAFAFSFLFEAVVAGGGTVERIAVIFAIYPLTDFFRSMVFGSAGNFAVSTGKQLGNMAKNLTTSAVGAAAGAGMGLAAGAIVSKAGGNIGTASGAAAESAIGGGTGGKAVGSGGGFNRGGTSAADKMRHASALSKDNSEAFAGIAEKDTTSKESGARGAKAMSYVAGGLGTLSSITSTGMRTMNGMMEGVAMGNSQLATNSAKELGGAMGAGVINSAAAAKNTVGQVKEDLRTRQIDKNINAIRSVGASENEVYADMSSKDWAQLTPAERKPLEDAGFKPVASNEAKLNNAQIAGNAIRNSQSEIKTSEADRDIARNSATSSQVANSYLSRKNRTQA